jgi:hypothetical protein
LEKEGGVPEGMWLADNYVPNRKARIMFRARQG